MRTYFCWRGHCVAVCLCCVKVCVCYRGHRVGQCRSCEGVCVAVGQSDGLCLKSGYPVEGVLWAEKEREREEKEIHEWVNCFQNHNILGKRGVSYCKHEFWVSLLSCGLLSSVNCNDQHCHIQYSNMETYVYMSIVHTGRCECLQRGLTFMAPQGTS